MKLLNHFKNILLFAVLCALSFAIWYGGPMVSFGDTIPLYTPEKRIYLIILLFVIWIFKMTLLNSEKPSELSAFATEQLKKINTMQARFQGAVHFLKSTVINKQGRNINLFQLPWYLLIGPGGSGKTSMLANSNIHFLLSKQFKSENLNRLSPSDSYDWWVTRDLVLVDVPGNIVFEEKKDYFLWNRFLAAVKKCRKESALNGIVIALNLPELIKKENQARREAILISLRNAILQIKKHFGSYLPFYLVITKCDLISGFNEFFGDCSSDELAQAWGITIPPLQSNEKLLEVFTHRFNALIKRLNEQLLSRIHHERNTNARPFIKDFPLHIERLKETISQLLKAIKIPDLNLEGVYLTSAIQLTPTEKQAANIATIQSPGQNALQLFAQAARPNRPFFIKQLILQGLLNQFAPPSSLKNRWVIWQRRLVYTFSLAAIITATVLLGRDFQQGVQKAYSLENLLSQYQISLERSGHEPNHLAKALPLLDALQDAAEKSNRPLSRFGNYLNFYSSKSQKTAVEIYHQALQTIVVPQIKNNLENYMRDSANKNPARIYAALKAYLMLDKTLGLDTHFIIQTITQTLPNHFDEHQRDALSNHLETAFSELKPLNLNNNIIINTRKSLADLSHIQLAFVILKNNGNNILSSEFSPEAYLNTSSALTAKKSISKIPNMYTARYFPTILTQQISIAANEALRGNAVLGELPNKMTQAEESTFAQDLEKQYIDSYTSAWENLLANIQLAAPNNLQELDNIVANLASDTSPLTQLLQALQQNTVLAPVLANSPKLQAVNILLINSGNQKSVLYPIFLGLKELHNYLQPILSASNIDEAAFLSAKARLQDPARNDAISQLKILAEQSPEPVKSWLEKLSHDSWHFILKSANLHVQARWKTAIIPNYSLLEKRFPFKSNATEEVDTQQFINFFNPQGTLANFYHDYLRPFINEASNEWEWKRLDNLQLPISSNVLKQLQYAMQLQHAVFQNGDSKLFVAFTLQPVSLDKDTRAVTLNINGQSIAHQKSAAQSPRMLTWPGNNPSHETSIHFATDNHGPVNQTLPGDWSWFRLVQNSTKTVMSRKELAVTFNVNNHTARYLLFTQGHLNPFLPYNWERFHLPEELG